MDRFKKIMVCIDLTELDEMLIQYAHEFMYSLKAESLIFLHIYQKQHAPKFFGKVQDSSEVESIDSLNLEIRRKIEILTNKANYHWEIEILEGDTNDQMLEAVKQHSIDLLIMGRKQEIKNSEGLPKRTTKKSRCSVLLIPEVPLKKLNQVLVPVDFSEYSAFAIKISLSIIGTSGLVHCQHVYEVPSGYHKTGKDYNEFAKVMENNAIKDMGDFIKRYKLPEDQLKFVYSLDKKGRPAKEIIKYAKKINTKLITMGSKGRTGAASIILGSVAEDVVTLNDIFPLLVIKKKNENLGFFDAILKI